MTLSATLALGTVSYHPYRLEDALEGAQRAGYTHVELAAGVGEGYHLHTDMADARIDTLRRRITDMGLQVSGINGNIGLMTVERAAHTKKAITLAKNLGAPILCNTVAGPGSHEEDLDRFLGQIDGIARHAEQTGVVLAIEVHGDKTGSGQLMNQVIQRVDHPHVKINYDTANCVFYTGTWPYEDLKAALPNVAQIHLKDKIDGKGIWNFPPAGSGQIDFSRVINILDTGGFGGQMSVEIEFDASGWPPVEAVHEAAASARTHLLGLIDAR